MVESQKGMSLGACMTRWKRVVPWQVLDCTLDFYCVQASVYVGSVYHSSFPVLTILQPF